MIHFVPYLFKIHFNILLLVLGCPNYFLPSDSAFTTSPVHTEDVAVSIKLINFSQTQKVCLTEID